MVSASTPSAIETVNDIVLVHTIELNPDNSTFLRKNGI